MTTTNRHSVPRRNMYSGFDGRLVRLVRDRLGLSSAKLRDLVQATGQDLSQSGLSRLERGEGLPSPVMARAISRAFGYSDPNAFIALARALERDEPDAFVAMTQALDKSMSEQQPVEHPAAKQGDLLSIAFTAIARALEHRASGQATAEPDGLMDIARDIAESLDRAVRHTESTAATSAAPARGPLAEAVSGRG